MKKKNIKDIIKSNSGITVIAIFIIIIAILFIVFAIRIIISNKNKVQNNDIVEKFESSNEYEENNGKDDTISESKSVDISNLKEKLYVEYYMMFHLLMDYRLYLIKLSNR